MTVKVDAVHCCWSLWSHSFLPVRSCALSVSANLTSESCKWCVLNASSFNQTSVAFRGTRVWCPLDTFIMKTKLQWQDSSIRVTQHHPSGEEPLLVQGTHETSRVLVMTLVLASLLLVPLFLLMLLVLLTVPICLNSAHPMSTQPHALRQIPVPTPSAAGAGFSAIGDGQYVDKGGPVLLACGQGKSLYDVKGCLSSWVLLGGGLGQSDAVREKLAAAGGGVGAEGRKL